MVSFELSMTNLIITAAILILAVLYVVILLKMKPSKEKEDFRKKIFVAQKREPSRDEPVFVNSLKTEEKAPPKTTQTQTDPEKIRLSSTKIPSTSAPIDKNQMAPKHVVEPANQPSTRECAHHFGYLRELPKNTQIPGECLGCPQIVECMITSIYEKRV